MKVTEFVRMSQRYLYFRSEATKADARKNEARDYLKEYIAENAEPDENGTKRLYFDNPYVVETTKFAGLELRKSQPKDQIDIDAAQQFIKDQHLEHQVVKMVPIYDWDQLVILNQQGRITDEQLDALFITPDPTYSLYTIEE